jgi:hypothetical protein
VTMKSLRSSDQEAEAAEEDSSTRERDSGIIRTRGLRCGSCWDCGFESDREHGYLSLLSVVYCQVEFSASG